MSRCGVGVVLFGLISVAAALDWSSVDQALERSRANGTFPGCVGVVADSTGILYVRAVGSFTYGQPAPESGTNPPTTDATRFDMASVTKVFATTTAAMLLYQRGYLGLDELLSSEALLGPQFAANGKGSIAVRNLLLHNAGFPPDPVPNYWAKEFGCPETQKPHPALSFNCRNQIVSALLAQKLDNAPGVKFVYSDLSMITLMFAIGKRVHDRNLVSGSSLRSDCVAGTDPRSFNLSLAQCYYEAFVQANVVNELGLLSTGFLPDPSVWSQCAPTWNDTGYRNAVMQGYVSDGNAYALGGIAGHAGFFSTAWDVAAFVSKVLFAPDNSINFVNRTTVELFTTVKNLTQSSRALGWDTNACDPANYGCDCGTLSQKTFTHTGYTGTQICADPERKLFTALLTNRVYPDDSPASKDKIHYARQAFNTAVQRVVDGKGQE